MDKKPNKQTVSEQSGLQFLEDDSTNKQTFLFPRNFQ